MASYYKYAERDVANEIDWRAITGEITQNMKDIEKAREDKRVAIQKASGDAMKRMMEKPQGEDFLENNRVANYAQQAQEIQLENLRLLKRGDISEREYSLRFNNLTTGTDMVFNLSKEYQDSYQMHMDRMKPDENGIVLASGIESDMLGKAEQYGNPKDSQYYINPLTGEVNLALTKEDGETGQVTIGDSQFDLMSLGTARNIIFQKVNKYQTQTQVKGLVEGLKTEVNEALGTGALEGYITKEKGLDIDRLFEKKDGKLVRDEGKAILASINATFAGDDFSRASFLFDTVKTIDGEVVELVYPDPEGNFPELKKNQIKMVLNKQNRYVPEITDEQNRIIEKNMVGLIKNGIDKEFGITADTRMTDYQRFQVGKINRELREKKDSLQLRLDTISELYRGGDVDLQAATTFFRDIDPNIVEINRSDTGVAVTILDRETGEREIRDISFFGETDGKIDTNKPLDERDFIKAASNILLGKEAAESSEYLNLYNRKKKVGDEEVFVYDRKLRNEGKATADTSLSGGGTGRNTYSISTNKYIDEMLDSEALDFGGSFPLSMQDNDLAKALQTQFADLGLKAEATGGASNEVFVTIPGVQERVIIDANNFTPSGIRGEKDKLRKFLATAIKKLKLEEKLNLEPDPNQGRFSKYN